MALSLETGNGSATAESYASAAYLKTYAEAVGATIPSGERDREILLRKAMRRMERGEAYQGCRATQAQALDWPRAGVLIDGYGYDSSAAFILEKLRKAQCEFAIAASTVDLAPTVAANAAGPIIEETLGPLTTRYADTGMTSALPRVEAAEALLAPLLRAKGGTLRLVRS